MGREELNWPDRSLYDGVLHLASNHPFMSRMGDATEIEVSIILLNFLTAEVAGH